MNENKKIISFVNGSLFELIPTNNTREYIAEEIEKQTRGLRLCFPIQKIVLGLISTEIHPEKKSQCVSVSVHVAKFIAIENGKTCENEAGMRFKREVQE